MNLQPQNKTQNSHLLFFEQIKITLKHLPQNANKTKNATFSNVKDISLDLN